MAAQIFALKPEGVSALDVDAAAAVVAVTVISPGVVGLGSGSVQVTFTGPCVGRFLDIGLGSQLVGPACTKLSTTTAGTYTYESCTTGVLRATATFDEPSGTATIENFLAVLVAGIGLVVASPLTSPSSGYADDSSLGSLVGIAVMIPNPVGACSPPGAQGFQLTLAFVAEY